MLVLVQRQSRGTSPFELTWRIRNVQSRAVRGGRPDDRIHSLSLRTELVDGPRPIPMAAPAQVSPSAAQASRPPRFRRARRSLRWACALIVAATLIWAARMAWREYRARTLLGQAEQAYAHHRVAAALSAAQKVLDIRPGDPRGSLVAARCLTRLRRAVEAEPYYRNAAPLDLDDLQSRALALFESNQVDKAGEVYEEILRRWPDDLVTLRRLGAVRIAQSRWEDALALADRLILTPGGELVGQTLKGSVCDYMGLHGQAVAADQRVLDLDPELHAMPLPKSSFWNQFAHSLLAEGRTQEVVTYLSGAKGVRDDPSLLEMLGKAYQKSGQTDLAEQCWRRALETAPSRSDPWLLLGRNALQRKQFEEAIRLLSRASELSPEALDPLYSLSQAHRLLGHRAEAERLEQRIDHLRRASQAQGSAPKL